MSWPLKKVILLIFFYSVADSENNLKLSRKNRYITAQKMKFSIKDFFSKCDQIRRKLRIWSHLLKKSLVENSIFFEEIFIYIINKYTFEKARSIQDVTISRTNQKRFFYCSVSSFCLNK